LCDNTLLKLLNAQDEEPSHSDYPEGVVNDDVDDNLMGDCGAGGAQCGHKPPVAKARMSPSYQKLTFVSDYFSEFFPDSHDFCINGGTFCEVEGNSVICK